MDVESIRQRHHGYFFRLHASTCTVCRVLVASAERLKPREDEQRAPRLRDPSPAEHEPVDARLPAAAL